MTVIETKAAALQKAVAPDVDGYGFDPSTWINLIKAIIDALGACKKTPAQLAKTAQRPGLVGRFALRQVVIRELGRDTDEPVSAVVKQVLKLGAATSERDAKKMFAEAEAA